MLLYCKAGHDNDRVKCLPVVSLVSGIKSLFCCFPGFSSENQKAAVYGLRVDKGHSNQCHRTCDHVVKTAIKPKLPPHIASSRDCYFDRYRSPLQNDYLFVRQRRVPLSGIRADKKTQVILFSRGMGATRSRAIQEHTETHGRFQPEKRPCTRASSRKKVRDDRSAWRESIRGGCVSCLSSTRRGFGKSGRPVVPKAEVYAFSRRSSTYEIVQEGQPADERSLAPLAAAAPQPPLCERRRCEAKEVVSSFPSKYLRIGGGANSAFTPVTNRRQRKSRQRTAVHCKKITASSTSDNAADDEMDSDDQAVAFEKYREEFFKFIYPVGRSPPQSRGKNSMAFSNGTSDSSGIGVDSVYSLLGAEAADTMYRSAASMPQTLSISEIELDSEQKPPPGSFHCLSPVKAAAHARRRVITVTTGGRRIKEAPNNENKREHFHPKPIAKAAPVNNFLSLSCFQETVL